MQDYTNEDHEAAVRDIAQAIRAHHLRKEPFRIFHGSTNSTRPAHGAKLIDISHLSHVLHVDTGARSVLVEPNVPMDRLITATLEHGLVPPVVMEFPGITVGGGYAGSAGESSSFRYGYFDQTVNWVEFVLGNGEVVRASREENADLFRGAAGALGTLGVTTLVELQLIPAKRFVKTTYHRTTSVAQTITTIKNETEAESNDYVDGILFSKTNGAVMVGKLTDDKPENAQPVTFSRPWDPWYYLHVQNKSSAVPTVPIVEDYVPIAEYLFRWDRGGFWVGREAFRYFSFVPFNRATRWLLDDFLHTRMMYRSLQGSNMSFGTMVQDLSLPYSTAEDLISYSASELAIWPLWLCPLRDMAPPSFHPTTTLPGPDPSPKPMLNIGLWGRASHHLGSFVAQNRGLEQRLTELGGRKVLYSHTYYPEGEFWSLYDKEWYLALREKYAASGLPTVYDKVKMDLSKTVQTRGRPWQDRLWSAWPFAGIAGIRSAIKSKDYYMHRKPAWRKPAALEMEREAPGLKEA